MKTAIALSTCAIVAGWAGGLGAMRATAEGSAHACGVVSGAHWHMFHQSGTAYRVTAASASECSTAKHWVPRLSHLTAAQLVKHGPPGYHCGPGTGLETAWLGGCLKHGSFAFSWGPKLAH